MKSTEKCKPQLNLRKITVFKNSNNHRQYYGHIGIKWHLISVI